VTQFDGRGYQIDNQGQKKEKSKVAEYGLFDNRDTLK
jgi:hypothetical protein